MAVHTSDDFFCSFYGPPSPPPPPLINGRKIHKLDLDGGVKGSKAELPSSWNPQVVPDGGVKGSKVKFEEQEQELTVVL